VYSYEEKIDRNSSAVDAPLIADLHAPNLVEDAELRDRPHGEAPMRDLGVIGQNVLVRASPNQS